MNGAIIDDEHIYELAFAETVKDYDIKLGSHDYLTCCAGKTDRKGYEDIAQKFDTEINVEELL